jgi:hypothetical protein
MPAVAITIPNPAIALKHAEISDWVVGVDRRSPYLGPLFALFDENQNLRSVVTASLEHHAQGS